MPLKVPPSLVLAAALSLSASGLSGCAQEPAAAPEAAAPPPGVDLSRPCALLTAEMATQISGRPYFRAMVVNSVDGDAVTCAHAVGAGGMQGLVRAIVHLPRATGPAELRFVALCRGDVVSRLSRQSIRGPLSQEGPVAATIEEAAPMNLGQTCALPRGGFAILLQDRVMEVGYEQADGSMEPEISRLFAQAILNKAEAPPAP